VLSTSHRLTDGASFRRAVRTGRRSGSRTLVVHLATADDVGDPRVGFVVSKAVGNAVVRNRVKRRLRHLDRGQVSSLPGSAVLVIRALPGAGEASGAQLRADLDHCLAKVAAEVPG
jgi:ribonuclease P protein component